MIVRRIIAILVAALIGLLVVENAAVQSFAGTKPVVASRLWAGHPASELSLAMTEIAQATRAGRAVPQAAFALIADAAVKDPLAPEPFLVRGVQAELAGDGATAQRAFEAAQWRDPRSLAAAYFLADRYLRTGDAERGLRQVAALSRLSPDGSITVAPYLAAYAADAANWPALRKLFRTNPGLADPALATLASNIRTVPAVLAIAARPRDLDQAHWIAPLLNTLASAGEYAKARAIWARVTGVEVQPGQLLYDTSFSDKRTPPPFNWTLTSSAVGLAERQPGGRLHIVFYGQDDGILASQLLLLPPGAYRLSMQLLGDPARARALNWSLWCHQADAPVASVTLDAAARRGWQFTVPAGCPGQWLKLSGSSSDVSQQSDETIAGLKLERAGPGA